MNTFDNTKNTNIYFLITCVASATGSPPIDKHDLISGMPSASRNLAT